VFEALQRRNARGRLKRAFEVTDAVDSLSFEEKGLLARHLCVMSAGVLEESVRLHLSEYAGVVSRGFLPNFTSQRVSKITNLTSDRLISLLRELDDSLAREMEAFIDDRRKAAMNSLIARRHDVAHGKDAGVSLATVKGYRDIILEVLDKLDEIFARISA
jgi:RiboL-PSP-HEPN